MKLNKNILLLICVLQLFCKAQITFNNYYRNDYKNNFSLNVLQQTDSSTIVYNNVQDSLTGRLNLNLFKINKLGVLLQNKTSNVGVDYLVQTQGLKNIIQNSNYSYIASTVTYTNTNNNATVIFVKINKNTLDTLKTNFYDDNTYSYYLPNFIKINSNKYFLIGNKFNSSNQWPVIFQIDSSLNVINITTLNNPINITTTNAVYNPITKKILFGGYKNFNNININLYFIETDTLGVISNTAIITNTTLQGIQQLKYSAFDNSYVFCGNYRTSKVGNTNNYRLQLTKLNSSNLNVLWSKTYGEACNLNNLNSLIVNSDGSMVSCGRYADSTYATLIGNYDATGVLLKVNAIGDSLWMRQYNNYLSPPNPNNYQEILIGVEKTYDGGYIACGGVINQPQGKAWVLKTDSLGCVNAGCGAVINGTLVTGQNELNINNNSGKTVNIYPNPTNGILNINANDFSKNALIKIQNMLGQEVINCKIESEINIKELKSGIYFLKIVDDEKLISTQKIIKE